MRKAIRYITLEDQEVTTQPTPKLWHQITKHPLFMPYHRLAVLMLMINVLILRSITENFTISALEIPQNLISHLVLGNFAIAFLIRQQYVINFLFKCATSAPLRLPLTIRWALGKIYHFGGIHVGGFLSGSLWFFLLTTKFIQTESPQSLHAVFSFGCCLLLALMMIVALPQIRSRYHNQFEVIARFGSWLLLLFFWGQALLVPTSQFVTVISVLTLLTFSTALPWLRLRRVPVCCVTPSNHVSLTDFAYGVTPFAGSSTELSRNPLLEWHSFANVPYPGKEGFQLTISRAGDWTGKWIDEKPEQVWVKGIPTAGVGNIEKLFKKVIWVATGSGIGPCLPHLLSNEVPSRLIWSTRTPRDTYGEELSLKILDAQPQALIWDTNKQGKPDLVRLALEACTEFEAEAVICIANKQVTWDVVYQLESRGIPAFGAIWDS